MEDWGHMEKIGPGMYVERERGSLHIYAEEMCEAFGVPATEQNMRKAERAALKMAEDAYGKIPIVWYMAGHTPEPAPEDPN